MPGSIQAINMLVSVHSHCCKLPSTDVKDSLTSLQLPRQLPGAREGQHHVRLTPQLPSCHSSPQAVPAPVQEVVSWLQAGLPQEIPRYDTRRGMLQR